MIRSIPTARAQFSFPRLGQTTSQTINTGVSAAGSIAVGLAPIIGITAAIPFVGPIVAGVTAIIGALGIGNGCGQTCIKSTEVVNYWEPFLQRNLAAAQQVISEQGCLTEDERTTLLNNFDQIWGNVYQQCMQIPAPGGTQCISDRAQGSTKIAGGSWFTLYRDPIAAMTTCPASASGLIAPLMSADGSQPAPAPPAGASYAPPLPAAAPAFNPLYVGLGLVGILLLVRNL